MLGSPSSSPLSQIGRRDRLVVLKSRMLHLQFITFAVSNFCVDRAQSMIYSVKSVCFSHFCGSTNC